MIKLTKEETDLCRQIAEKYRKEIEYADWYWSASYNEPLLATDGGFKVREQEHHGVFKLWTISDCLEFLRERKYEISLHYFYHTKRWMTQLWLKSTTACYSDYDNNSGNKTPLESILASVLAVLEEGK